MELIENLVLILHLLSALAVIGLVLIQQGKGAEAGSGFGSGSAGTVFGSSGAGNFLTKITTIIAIVFFLTSFSLAYFAKGKADIARNLGIPEVVDEQTVLPDLGIEEEAADEPVGESEIPDFEAAPETTESETPDEK